MISSSSIRSASSGTGFHLSSFLDDYERCRTLADGDSGVSERQVDGSVERYVAFDRKVDAWNQADRLLVSQGAVLFLV